MYLKGWCTAEDPAQAGNQLSQLTLGWEAQNLGLAVSREPGPRSPPPEMVLGEPAPASPHLDASDRDSKGGRKWLVDWLISFCLLDSQLVTYIPINRAKKKLENIWTNRSLI